MHSMTGYGRMSVERDGRQLTVELKSVNHRFLDLSFRMPRSFNFLEDSARKLIGEYLSRGHVDLFATYRNTREDSRRVETDQALLADTHNVGDVGIGKAVRHDQRAGNFCNGSAQFHSSFP